MEVLTKGYLAKHLYIWKHRIFGWHCYVKHWIPATDQSQLSIGNTHLQQGDIAFVTSIFSKMSLHKEFKYQIWTFLDLPFSSYVSKFIYYTDPLRVFVKTIFWTQGTSNRYLRWKFKTKNLHRVSFLIAIELRQIKMNSLKSFHSNSSSNS